MCAAAMRALQGGVVEWLMAPVLKTGDPQGSVGSNPTPSVSELKTGILESSLDILFMALSIPVTADALAALNGR